MLCSVCISHIPTHLPACLATYSLLTYHLPTHYSPTSYLPATSHIGTNLLACLATYSLLTYSHYSPTSLPWPLRRPAPVEVRQHARRPAAPLQRLLCARKLRARTPRRAQRSLKYGWPQAATLMGSLYGLPVWVAALRADQCRPVGAKRERTLPHRERGCDPQSLETADLNLPRLQTAISRDCGSQSPEIADSVSRDCRL